MNDATVYLAVEDGSQSVLAVEEQNLVALRSRLIFLALVFSFELLLVSFFRGREGLTPPSSVVSARGGVWILRGIEGFLVLFITFAWLTKKAALVGVSIKLGTQSIGLWLLTAHLCSFAIFGVLTSMLYGGASSNLLITGWVATGICAIAFGAFAFIGPVFWLQMARETGFLWVWACLATLLACLAGRASHFLWPVATSVTFGLSETLLRPFIPGLFVDPAHLLIGTQRFAVHVSESCSGMEGIGLILAFGILWLVLFRRECRFPHALILLPVGAATIFALNAVRIAALVFIGDAGAPQVAMHGFHSQAGWIVFNLVALGLCGAARRAPWLRVGELQRTKNPSKNPTTRWLLPFVMILAGGMISAAVTSNFEWLYPVRFFAAAVTLVFLRRRYRDLDWRAGWLAPIVGLVVFLVWVGLDRFISVTPEAMPAPLATASPLVRTLWLLFRVLSATITVPLAEELAFRGFLYRRLLSPDFESVPFQRLSWQALLIGSAIFGVLHGDRWFVGAVAGALYTLVLVWRGRIGDAVVAHATTNALIVIDVLAFHHWHLW